MMFRRHLAGVLAAVVLIAAVASMRADLRWDDEPCVVDFSRHVEESRFMAEHIDAEERRIYARLHGAADDPCWPFLTKDCRGPMPRPLTAGP